MSIATLTNFKDRIEAGSSTTDDGFYQEILDRASAKITSILGREVESGVLGTVTEYHDGTGHQLLVLRNGPLVTVSQVNDVSYDSAGNESTSGLTANADYFLGHERSKSDKLPGYLIRNTSSWIKGQRNYQIVYTAGWDSSTTTAPATMPQDLREACLHAAVWMWQKRKDAAKADREVGSSVASLRDERELDGDLRQMVMHYMSFGGGV